MSQKKNGKRKLEEFESFKNFNYFILSRLGVGRSSYQEIENKNGVKSDDLIRHTR